MTNPARAAILAALGTAVAAGLTIVPAASADPPPRAPIQLGDLDAPASAQQLGAPFDPCSKSLWDGVPAEVRPAKPRQPRMIPSEPGPPLVICALENADAVGVQVNPDGSGSHSVGRTMSIYIAWGESLAPLRNGRPTSFAGKSGQQAGSADRQGRPKCDTRVQLSRGSGGAVVLNDKFPAVDTCTIARAVTEHIAATTP